MATRSTKCIFLGYGTDGQFGYCLWEPDHQWLLQSSDVVFNEDTISTDNVWPKSRKWVNFDVTPANPEDHADESRASTETRQ